jgi:hypothetical protein
MFKLVKENTMHKLNVFLVSTVFISLLSVSNVISADDHASVKNDSRQAIVLTEKERSLVLMEMRAFLESVQAIIVALSKDDWEKVGQAAKKSGMGEQKGMPASLRQKLPKEFKIMGMKTHKAFDQLALDSKDIGDKQQTLEQLGSLMNNCVSCHAIFKFTAEK